MHLREQVSKRELVRGAVPSREPVQHHGPRPTARHLSAGGGGRIMCWLQRVGPCGAVGGGMAAATGDIRLAGCFLGFLQAQVQV